MAETTSQSPLLPSPHPSLTDFEGMTSAKWAYLQAIEILGFKDWRRRITAMTETTSMVTTTRTMATAATAAARVVVVIATAAR